MTLFLRLSTEIPPADAPENDLLSPDGIVSDPLVTGPDPPEKFLGGGTCELGGLKVDTLAPEDTSLKLFLGLV